MKIVFKKEDYKTYKDFYTDILRKLNAKRFIDWEDEKDLGYNGNLLGEFLWYTSEDSNDYIFVNFNKENMNPEKKQEDKEWQIIFYYFENLVKEHPNNTLAFIND